MKKSYGTTLLSLIFLLGLMAACTAAPERTSGGEEAASAAEMTDDMAMAEDSHDDTMMAETEAEGHEEMVDEMAEESHDEMMADDVMAEESMDDETMMEEDEGMMMERPVWQTIALTDARSGDTFTLADFAGKTVYVEPMATWCTNCRRQLNNVEQAIQSLGDQEDIIFVALSVETNLRAAELADYAFNEGFSMVFSVMPEEMLSALVEEFGRSAANPPSTPHFVIRPDGSYTELVTGFESGPEVIDFIASNQS